MDFKYSTEYSLLIIVGLWNRNIFIPEWVTKYLLPDEKVNAQIPILDASASMKISTDTSRIFVKDNKLNIVALKHDFKTYEDIFNIGVKISDYLPHTPVSGIGINQNLELEAKPQLIKKIFKEDSALKLDSFSLTQSTITRIYEGKDFKLTVTLVSLGNKIIFDFNFHYTLSSLLKVKEILQENSVSYYREMAFNISQEIVSQYTEKKVVARG